MKSTVFLAAFAASVTLLVAAQGQALAGAPASGVSASGKGLNPRPARGPQLATFRPMDFRAKQPAQSYTQNETMVYANSREAGSQGGVTFAAPLRLPAGARLVSLTLAYSTLSSPNPLYNGELLCVMRGGAPVQILGVGGSSVTRGAVTETTTSTLIPSDPRYLIVNPRCEYGVEVYSHNISTRIHGLKVTYTLP